MYVSACVWYDLQPINGYCFGGHGTHFHFSSQSLFAQRVRHTYLCGTGAVQHTGRSRLRVIRLGAIQLERLGQPAAATRRAPLLLLLLLLLLGERKTRGGSIAAAASRLGGTRGR